MSQSVSERLRQAAAPIWEKCLHHPFVTAIGDGTLPVEKFQYFMLQDYLYLFDYARVFALGVVKARDPKLMRTFAENVNAILGGEMNIHRAYMERLGITELLEKYPYEVSGGQKQRAAVARALITNPRLILADEPTGALDSHTTDSLLSLFSAINEGGQTLLMVTHSVKAASHAGRVLFLRDGEVYHQLYRGNMSFEEMFAKVSDTLTMLTTGGERHA